MVNRNGSASEDLSRWRSAGSFQGKRSVWIVHVWIADSPLVWKFAMESWSTRSRKASPLMWRFLSGSGSKIHHMPEAR